MLIAYANGRYVNIDDPIISLEDRGYQFGDGIYEVVRIYQGKPWLWKPHIDRLILSAQRMGIKFSLDEKNLLEIYTKLQEKNNLPEAALYIQLTRGASPRKHWISDDLEPVLVMTLREASRPEESSRQKGVKAIMMPDERWARCHIKSLNLLPNILAKRAADKENASEVLFYLENNTITEGSSSNVMVVKDGVIYTHPEDKKILSGITRLKVLEIARNLGITVQEQIFKKDFMLDSDEIFITSTVMEILPITLVDDKKIGNGMLGPVFKQIYARYLEEIEEFVK